MTNKKSTAKAGTINISVHLNKEKDKQLIEIMKTVNNKQGFMKKAIRLAAFLEEVNRIRMRNAAKQ